MDASQLRLLLNEGIQAIRAGEMARGRALLLKVVEADERIEPAWLWLASVLENPTDQITALENALTLNPQNEPARQRLSELRAAHPSAATGPKGERSREAAQSKGPALPEPPPTAPVITPAALPSAPPTPSPSVAEPARYSAIDPDDDPLQCPYCGKLTAETDNKCPHCHKSLLRQGAWAGGGFLYFLLIALGLNVQGAVLEIGLPWAVRLLSTEMSFLPKFLADYGLGNGLVDIPLAWLALRLLLLGGTLALFLNDVPFAFSAGAVISALDVIVTALGWWRGDLPRVIAGWNGGLSAIVLVISVLALLSQSTTRRRLYTQLDRTLYGALGFYQRGREHQHQGQWALAVMHWQKALVLQPTWIDLYKELGLAQARLGRHAKALNTLNAGAHRAPQDADFPRLIAEIQGSVKRAKGPYG
jgi:tetratricopeptide (TPR) repeat protein